MLNEAVFWHQRICSYHLFGCFGLVDKKRYARTKNNFMSRYFRDTYRVYSSNVKQVYESRGWETDEDAVKFVKFIS